MTAQQLITSSLRLIGVLASGESPSASEAQDGLTALNNLIDSWSNENLMIFTKLREVFAFIANQRVYTMGTGGNFSTLRPQKIENALIQIASNSPVLELPIQILSKDEYAAITIKTVTATFPLYMYCDYANPLANISVWPVPTDSSNNIVLYSWKPLANISALTSSLSLPPGYLRALIYNLAIDLAPEYGRQVAPTIPVEAVAAKAVLKRMNNVTPLLNMPSDLVATPAIYDWRTDGYNR